MRVRTAGLVAGAGLLITTTFVSANAPMLKLTPNQYIGMPAFVQYIGESASDRGRKVVLVANPQELAGLREAIDDALKQSPGNVTPQ